MIKCNKCGSNKQETDFYPRNRVCKKCYIQRVKDYSSTEKGKEVHKKANKKYSQTEAGVAVRDKCNERYHCQESSRKKRLAKWAVKRAISSGKLIRKPCEVCGEANTHGHHTDYNNKLDVIWLCALHHKEWHIKNGEAKNAY